MGLNFLYALKTIEGDMCGPIYLPRELFKILIIFKMCNYKMVMRVYYIIRNLKFVRLITRSLPM